MRRAIIALVAIACGCTPTVLLGTLAPDAGGAGDLSPGCPTCDLSRPADLLDLTSRDLDLADGGSVGDFAQGTIADL